MLHAFSLPWIRFCQTARSTLLKYFCDIIFMSKRTIVTWDELSGSEARGISKEVDLGEV